MALSTRERRRRLFGHAVRTAREELGWSQIRLAEEVSQRLEDRTVTQGAVSKWENGAAVPQRDKMPTIEQVLKLDAGSLTSIVDGFSVPAGTAAKSGLDMSDLPPEDQELIMEHIEFLRGRRRAREA